MLSVDIKMPREDIAGVVRLGMPCKFSFVIMLCILKVCELRKLNIIKNNCTYILVVIIIGAYGFAQNVLKQVALQ